MPKPAIGTCFRTSYCWRFDFVSFTAGKPIAGAKIGIAGLCRRLMPSHVARQATGY
ncbi:hypothetical protein X740_11240 [Mesorhizobium sp. LNHC221B00]|nr:hypothetical protein X740_11240 [Mesorhizobium sp. LNHC221B00]